MTKTTLHQQQRPVIKSALIYFRQGKDGKEVMMVRSKDKEYFVFPGGKQEPGETLEQALERELKEELDVGVKNIERLGVCNGNTPDGRVLQENMFLADMVGTYKPSSEITEIIWLTRPAALILPTNKLTPMALEHVFPFLAKRGLW